MKRLIICFAVALGALPVSHSSGQAEPEAPTCTAENARAVTIDDILGSPDAFIGVCVKVSGLLVDRALFPDLKTYYRARGYAKRLAIYSDNDSLGDLWNMRAVAETVGTATTCSRLADDSRKEVEEKNKRAKEAGNVTFVSIPFIGGLCHYTNIPALLVSQIKILPGPIRLLASKENRSFADLVEIPARKEERREVVERWYDAVRRGDAPAIVEITGVDNVRLMEPRLFDKNLSPLRRLLQSSQPADIHYFRHKDWKKIEPRERETIACVCKEETCAGQWPIADDDTWNGRGPNWPYYCLRIGPAGFIY